MQPDLVVSTLPIASLVPYAENARTHSPTQVAQIAASIAEFGRLCRLARARTGMLDPRMGIAAGMAGTPDRTGPGAGHVHRRTRGAGHALRAGAATAHGGVI